MTRYTRWKRALLAAALGSLFAAGAGGCLPRDFYADLAGATVDNIVQTIVSTVIERALSPA